MKKRIIRLISVAMTVLLLLGSLAVMAAPEASKAAGNLPSLVLPEGMTADSVSDDYKVNYEQVATGDGATLFADLTNSKFALRNDKTGYIWYSTPSDILTDQVTMGLRATELASNLVIGFVNRRDEARVASISYTSAAEIKVEKIDNGIRAIYDFSSVSIRVPVEYRLEKGTLVSAVQLKDVVTAEDFAALKIEEGTWTQDDADMSKDSISYLMSVWLTPGFGAQNPEQQGYVFIPDGSGALVDFESGFAAPNTLYEKPVYGKEKAQTIQDLETYEKDIFMPVFGTVTEGNALCGIVEVGDEISSILSVGAAQGCGYTSVSCRVNLRDLYKSYLYQGTNNEREVRRVSTNKVSYDEYIVRYTMLDGDDASYVGMANLYRDYLINQKNLTQHKTEAAFNLDLLGCAETDANFIGFTYKKKLALTTFEQGQVILEALKESGIDNIATRLLGWTNNGISNRKPSAKANPLSKLGGTADFKALAAKADEYGSFYPNQDMLTFTVSGSGVSARQDCAKTVFGMPAYQYKYLYSVLVYDNTVTPSRLLSLDSLKSVSEQFKSSYAKLGVKSLSLDTLTSYCFSDFGKNPVYRDLMVKEITALLEDYAKEYELEGNAAYAYTLPYLTRITDVPLDSSQYDFFDQDVPFYSIVMHGYAALVGGNMNRSYDVSQSLLKSVETGSELRYMGMYTDSAMLKDTDSTDYYSTTYTLWKDEAANFWKQYSPLQKQIQNSVMVNHENLSDDVVRVTYDNGITVYVNYGDAAYTAQDGTNVEARGFAYVGGEQ